ncbi:MAG: M1 family metallopeptidase [archaeon]|nr:M1 family metallopeptidase [archaeon]
MSTEFEVLPKTFYPINYNLEFEPIPKESLFKGKTVIEMDCLEDTDKLVLNASDMKNIKAKVIEPNQIELTYTEDKENERITFEGNKFTKGKYKIEIIYDGCLSDQVMCGFYQSKYELNGETKIICSTQFESASARKAFPSYDEPGYKSTFDITMIVPKNEQCFANMPIKSETEINAEKKRVEFLTTVKMSTYLVCFICGEFTSYQDKTENGIQIGFHFPKCYEGISKFALETMSRCLTLYEKIFKLKFPLPKCDWVAIPSFEAGAMENWGCITSRIIEVVLKEDASISAKKRSASVVCHELAHMWFGDLVTMKWWDDLWLNEGFASYMGDLVGVNTLFPEWKLENSDYVESVLYALESDEGEATHAISVPIKKASEIDERFDAITYHKGSSLIAMMVNYVGFDNFIQGICNYLQKFQYSNAESNDMWRFVGEVAKIDLISIVKEWTYTPGFPLVTVELKDKKLKMKQERCGFSSDQIWKIPMILKYGDYTQNYLMDKKEVEIEWNYPGVMANANSNGFYRVAYSNELIEQFKTQTFNQRETMGICDDLFVLSKLGKTELKNYLTFLKTVKPFTPETYQTSRIIISHLKEIKNRFKEDKIEAYIKKEIKRLLEPALESLGMYVKDKDTIEESELRTLCLNNLENDKIKEEAINCILNNKINDLPSEMRKPFIFIVGKNADQKLFEALCDIYLNNKIPETQLIAARAIGMVEDEKILPQVMDFAWNKVKYQDFYMPACLSLMGKSEIPAKYLEDNIEKINERYQGGMCSIRNHVIEFLLDKYSSKEKYEYYKDFFYNKHKFSGCDNIVKSGLEKMLKRADWLEKNMEGLKEFCA